MHSKCRDARPTHKIQTTTQQIGLIFRIFAMAHTLHCFLSMKNTIPTIALALTGLLIACETGESSSGPTTETSSVDGTGPSLLNEETPVLASDEEIIYCDEEETDDPPLPIAPESSEVPDDGNAFMGTGGLGIQGGPPKQPSTPPKQCRTPKPTKPCYPNRINCYDPPASDPECKDKNVNDRDGRYGGVCCPTRSYTVPPDGGWQWNGKTWECKSEIPGMAACKVKIASRC
jgi:hypothetical protein